MRGLRRRTCSNPSPSFSATPGPKLSIRTSALSTRRSNASRPSGVVSSSVTLRLLRLTERKTVASSRQRGGSPRVSSPRPGRSILITSAPRSPRTIAASGPARLLLRSSTRRPAWDLARADGPRFMRSEPHLLGDDAALDLVCAATDHRVLGLAEVTLHVVLGQLRITTERLHPIRGHLKGGVVLEYLGHRDLLDRAFDPLAQCGAEPELLAALRVLDRVVQSGSRVANVRRGEAEALVLEVLA